ncbi:MAG: lipid-A-disaccharide synthase [Acaryochloris sp. RU_4_1]|nr:lipid-A-disaccharide synthase [Acaryochloris sp. RU_4_1]NJR55132.1 lipid-A-disaccharide synthase [Acaryochloris sp. CRU_2_0]
MPQSFRIFISTGEVSGDLQGSLLISALGAEASARGYSLEILALGGPQMAATGATLLADTSRIGAIGLIHALPYVWPTLKLHHQVLRALEATPPDLSVLIDYIGSNLRLGQRLKRQFPTPVVYYIAPPEWVWSQGLGVTRRVIDLSDKMLAIFQQEATYFAKHGADIDWVGHPLLDCLQAYPNRQQARQQLGIHPDQPMMALMPASRQQELTEIWPVMLAAAQGLHQQIPQLQFWIPLALPAFRSILTPAIRDADLPITLTSDRHRVLAAADGVIAKSGTVNLETALLGVPQVVVYRLDPVSAWLYQHIFKFKVEFISPVNIVANQAVVPELLQQKATPEQIAELAGKLLRNTPERQQMLAGYERVRSQLGEAGAVQRAAQAILDLLDRSQG